MSESPPPSRTQMLTRVVPPDRTGRIAMLMSCGLMLLCFLPVSACCFGTIFLEMGLSVTNGLAEGNLGPAALLFFSALVAVTFAIPHLLTILWLDRNEKEPVLLLATAFIWGIIMAVPPSIVVNELTKGLFLGLVLPHHGLAGQFTASFSAPLIEEVSKGMALLFIYLFFSKHFDNVLDGIIYGAMVGLGFAVFENFLYYMQQGDLVAAAGLSFWRGILASVGSHSAFTAMTGASIGLFRVMRAGPGRWFIPPLGLFMAIFAHFLWNTFSCCFMAPFAEAGWWLQTLVGLPLAVIGLQLPFVIVIAVTVAFALRHERKLIEKYLKDERESIMSPDELYRLVPARRRTLHSLKLVFTGQLGSYWRTRKRNGLLVKLAFERWHMDQEDALGDEQAAHFHALRVTEIRRTLRANPL